MEHLEGEKLSHVRGRLNPAAGKAHATSIALSILKQVFEDGIYHADPHPGNIILMPDGKVGLIDFGNVGRLTTEMVDDLLQLLVAILGRSYRDIAKWILGRGRPREEIDLHALALELMDALDAYYGLSLSEIRIGGLFTSLFGMVLRHGIGIPAPYALVGRTFVTLEGSLRLCSPDIELLPAIEPYMRDVAKRRWSPERLARDVRQELSEVVTAVRSYPTNLAEVLSRAAEGRLRVEPPPAVDPRRGPPRELRDPPPEPDGRRRRLAPDGARGDRVRSLPAARSEARPEGVTPQPFSFFPALRRIS
jgi:ubiquinone biosynthesis protein